MAAYQALHHLSFALGEGGDPRGHFGRGRFGERPVPAIEAQILREIREERRDLRQIRVIRIAQRRRAHDRGFERGQHARYTRDEFARIDDYLALMKIRMGERLQLQIDVPTGLLPMPFPAMMETRMSLTPSSCSERAR